MDICIKDIEEYIDLNFDKTNLKEIYSNLYELYDIKTPAEKYVVDKNIMNYLIKIICRRAVFDPTSGFQIINKKLLNYLCRINYFPQFSDANLIIDIILQKFIIKLEK